MNIIHVCNTKSSVRHDPKEMPTLCGITETVTTWTAIRNYTKYTEGRGGYLTICPVCAEVLPVALLSI